jgi:hypothetical protein
MVESAALLVDDILSEAPIRQWVVSFPYALRFLFATRPAVMGEVLGTVYRVIAGHLVKVVQIGVPADLSSPGWPPWCRSRG